MDGLKNVSQVYKPDHIDNIIRPLEGLMWEWEVKLAVAVVLTGLVSLLEYVLGIYRDLLSVSPILLTVAATMVVIDFFTGLVRAYKKNEIVSSARMRATGWKVIEYTTLVVVTTILQNGFATWLAPIPIAKAALAYISFTEALSSIENVTGSKKKARQIVDWMRRIITDPKSLLNVSDEQEQ